jgi:hypothetical protein
MSIHIHVTQELQVPDLKSLQDRVRLRGGHLVAYLEVRSAFFISARSYKVKWVATPSERNGAGFWSSLVTGLFGWWAIAGPYWSITALIWNWRGGFDVTDSLMRAHPGNSSLLSFSEASALRTSQENASRLSRRICTALIVLLIGGLAYLVWAVSHN